MLYLNYNGKLLKDDALIIGANNRGLRYGDGVFETMKYSNGKLILADEHFARLWKGMQTLQFDIPKHFTPNRLQDELLQLLLKNNHNDIARIRITICRSDGGLYDPANHQPNYILQTWPLPENNGVWNSNGLVLGIYEEARKAIDKFSNIKHNNYLPYVMAALFAKQQKWNDAILLNSNDRICDTTIANLFLIKDEMVYTPELSEGCVAGVMRKEVVSFLKGNNYSVTEKKIMQEDLLDADEIFLTNSIYNIRWVQRIGDKQFNNALTQKIYAALLPTIS